MANKALLGGLLSGTGEGMIAQGQQRREEAEALREAALERARERRKREFTRERDEASREYGRGLLSRTQVNDQGRLIGITRGGETKDLGIRVPGDEDTAGAGGDGGGASEGSNLSGTDRNLMERVARNYWGKMNAAGQFIMPEDARDNYVETLDRAGELAGAGVPITTATRVAAMSISGPLSESDAKEQAEKEAQEQFGGWTEGDERRQYVEQRVPELMEESRSAQQEYQRLLGRDSGGGDRGGLMGGSQRQGGGQERGDDRGTGTGSGSGQRPQAQSGQSASKAPPGQGTQADPYKAATQQHVDWFLENAPSGAVIEANGQLYTK